MGNVQLFLGFLIIRLSRALPRQRILIANMQCPYHCQAPPFEYDLRQSKL
jgi:hypothetical protein